MCQIRGVARAYIILLCEAHVRQDGSHEWPDVEERQVHKEQLRSECSKADISSLQSGASTAPNLGN